MILRDYEQEFFDGLDNGAARRNGIRKAIDAALEKQDAENAMELYYQFIEEDIFHCDNLQATLVFPEYLAYFEAHEELQDSFQHEMMWSFKWIINNFYQFHQISIDQIQRIFEQYADFCKRYNYSLRTYYEFLAIFIRESLPPEESFMGVTAREAFRRMMRTPRDDISDCKACELDNEFTYYLFVEDDLEKALDVIKPVFSGKLHCAEVPEVTYASLAEYYFYHDDLKSAVENATKSYRMIHRQGDKTGSLAKSLSFNFQIIAYHEPEKALKIMKEILPEMATNQNSTDCYTFFRAAYHVFLCLEKAGYHRIRLKLPFRDESLPDDDGQYDIPVLRQFMYDKAKYYADKLDARNGNTLRIDQLNRTFEFKNADIKKPSKLDIPALEYIDEYLDQGVLPQDFSLPKKKPADDEPQFADGALDGISYFHTEPYQDELGELEDIIRLAGSGNSRAAVSKTEKYFEDPEKRAFHLMDNVQEFIMDNRDELDPNDIYDYGIGLTVGAKNYEAVKIGLSVLEVFSDYNDKLLEAIMKLSSSDEFTLFCIWAVKRLENSNDLIFSMAQHTIGWGKIFAVYYLEPETDEIKQWLLYNGIHNSVHPGYLANKCFEAADVQELLESEPDIDELQAIAYIIYFLLEDGPTAGIRAYENGDDIIDSFLDNVQRVGTQDADDENFPRIVEFVRRYRDEPHDDEEEQ